MAKAKRKKFTPNTHILLHHEVDGVCPKCAKVLLYDKKGGKHKGYEIAHIYPLNATDAEKKLLSKEEKLSEDLNDNKNLLAMCLECHPKFDKPRTVEEYRWAVQKKKDLMAKSKSKSLWHTGQIETEVQEIIRQLKEQQLPDMAFDLSLIPLKIDEKTDSSLPAITKDKIKNYVKNYFHFIQNAMKNLERESPNTAELISNQIRIHYLALKKQGHTQQEIFTNIVDWVHTKTNQVSKDACEAFSSFFVQNCEVFDDNSQ